MGGTGHPLSVPPDTQPFVDSYVAEAQNNSIVPGGFCPMTGCATVVAVVTPEQFFPIFGSATFDQSVAQGNGARLARHKGPGLAFRNPTGDGSQPCRFINRRAAGHSSS